MLYFDFDIDFALNLSIFSCCSRNYASFAYLFLVLPSSSQGIAFESGDLYLLGLYELCPWLSASVFA